MEYMERMMAMLISARGIAFNSYSADYRYGSGNEFRRTETICTTHGRKSS